MNNETTQSDQKLTASVGACTEEALFLQRADDQLLAALASGSINILALAQEILAQRGLDRSGQPVGIPAARALLTPEKDSVSIDAFADDEHARIVAFRNRWHEANRINPVTFPWKLSANNAGLWTEQFIDFDIDDPFPLPDPPQNRAPAPTKPRR